MNKEDKILELLGTLIDKMDKFEQGQTKLEEGQARLEQGQARLEQRMEKLEQRMDRLEQRQDRLEQRMDRLEQRMEKLETEVSEIKSRLITIENDNKKRFDALFDGYGQLFELSGQINSRLDKAEATQCKHSLQILKLETERKSS